MWEKVKVRGEEEGEAAEGAPCLLPLLCHVASRRSVFNGLCSRIPRGLALALEDAGSEDPWPEAKPRGPSGNPHIHDLPLQVPFPPSPSWARLLLRLEPSSWLLLSI